MKPALLLVDLQRDFLEAPGLEPAAGEVVRGATGLLDGCRRRGIPVVHVRTTVSADRDDRMPHWRREGIEICVAGTPGHEPPPELRERDEVVLEKRWFSAFSGAGLDEALDRLAATDLILAGVHTHGCVRATALDAYQRGLRVWLASDAVGGYDGLHGALSAQYLDGRAATVLPGAEILERLERGGGPGGSEEALPPLDCPAAAVREWSGLPGEERARRLERAAEVLEERSAPLAEAIVSEIGKPRRYAEAEVGRGAALLRAAARLRDPEPMTGREAGSRRLPLGLVALITPFNNPVAVPLGKLGPALRLGNTVAWKPSPLAARTSGEMLEVLRCAGLGPDLVASVAGGRRAAEELMRDPRIDGISITGSSAAGYAAQAAAAARRIPLQAELGGNNAAIVSGKVGLDRVAREIAEAAFGFAGQRCTANRRVVVESARAEELVAALESAAAALPAGDPAHPDVVVGPLVSAAARERVAAVLERARAVAEVSSLDHLYRTAPPEPFLAASIVVCDDPAAEIVQEETFGPVLVVQPSDGFEHALELANGVRHGLVLSLFASSREHRELFLQEGRAGVLKLGRATADAGVEAPFGGWKASGIGPAEHGSGDVEFYTREQAVYKG